MTDREKELEAEMIRLHEKIKPFLEEDIIDPILDPINDPTGAGFIATASKLKHDKSIETTRKRVIVKASNLKLYEKH